MRLRFIGTLVVLDLGVWSGLENVLRMSPTRSLLHLLGRGAGPVIRRVWTLTCDRETRRPRPRRDGAKLTGAWASAPLTVQSLCLGGESVAVDSN